MSMPLETLRVLRLAVDPEDPERHQLLLVLEPEQDRVFTRGSCACVCGTTMRLTSVCSRTTEYVSRGFCQPESRFRLDEDAQRAEALLLRELS